MKYFLIFVIARLDRAIQRKNLDSPVKPENDKNMFFLNEFYVFSFFHPYSPIKGTKTHGV